MKGRGIDVLMVENWIGKHCKNRVEGTEQRRTKVTR